MTPLAVTPISRSSENFEEVSEIIFISDFEVCPISYHRSSKSFPKTTNTMSTSGLGLRNLNEIAFRFSVGIDQRRWQLSESNSVDKIISYRRLGGYFFLSYCGRRRLRGQWHNLLGCYSLEWHRLADPQKNCYKSSSSSGNRLDNLFPRSCVVSCRLICEHEVHAILILN